MKEFVIAAACTCLMAGAAMAQDGDAAKGEKDFRQCMACHSIYDASGSYIKKGGRVGPDLYGIAGRTAGSWDDFAYSASLKAAGQKGLVWNEEEFAKYVQDPAKYLKDYLGDPSARAKMTFKLRRSKEAADIWAYLVSVGPKPGN